MLKRTYFLDQIYFQHSIHSVCGLLGPRQVGKTTLAHQYALHYSNVHFIDLENPIDLARLENPMMTLSSLNSDLIIIDEIQRKPELFPILRVLVDEKPRKFLILGSASRDLLQQSSETLAGRIGYIELTPFSIAETHDQQTLWVQGGFPNSYMAKTVQGSYAWRQAYISTFMERDIPNLGFHIPAAQMRRLWMMLAHNHGNILNYSELGSSLGISHHTVRNYVEILEGTFMVRVLKPWFENINKRQIKTPKIYIRDSGLLHALLGIQNQNELNVYPRLGASWEGFALEEIISVNHAQQEECYFWAIQSSTELDLLIIKNGKRIGFEVKHTDAPTITKSMITALETLHLDHLYVIYPQKTSYPLADKISVQGLDSLKNIF
ncbi:MAG TPA: ATP-binding protein [Candidatus Babeliales bacterium]|nr:ATP-binding protein [Candidatus Babeliales bacterium]